MCVCALMDLNRVYMPYECTLVYNYASLFFLQLICFVTPMKLLFYCFATSSSTTTTNNSNNNNNNNNTNTTTYITNSDQRVMNNSHLNELGIKTLSTPYFGDSQLMLSGHARNTLSQSYISYGCSSRPPLAIEYATQALDELTNFS